MADYIDRLSFDDLAELDPAEVCRRTACTYDAGHKAYTVAAWGETYRIAPEAGTVTRLGATPAGEHGFFGLFLVHYLLAEPSGTLTNQWISEKEIPGGATFFRGPHELPTHLVTARFGNDLAALDRRCQALQGRPLEMGDAAYRFDIVPPVPVALVYWCGDEEFPAEAKLLFDKNLGRYLAADVVFALAVGVCERIAG